MEYRAFQHVRTCIETATAEQVLNLEALIQSVVSRQIAEIALAKRTALTVRERECPHCQYSPSSLHGRQRNGRQRFRCINPDCHRTYNVLTGTPMARARKPELWGRYLACMTNHLSIRKIIETGISVHQVTAWRWRHRFLKAAIAANTPLPTGVIEADETFFIRSFKGHRGWKNGKAPEQRAARRSAWGATKRGLSDEQVPVLTALDTSSGLYEAILPSLAGIEAALDGRIAAGSVLCSDGQKAYVRAAVRAGAEHRRITITKADWLTKTGGRPPRKKGRLGLGRVNAHHGRLKVLINGRCRGVATRYLDSYLAWHRAMRRDGFEGRTLLERSLMLGV